MAQAIVKDPDGNKIATINIPEGATNEQIQQKIQAVKAQAMQRSSSGQQEEQAPQTEQPQQDEQGFLSAAADTAAFVGGSALSEIGAGISGLATGSYNQSAETGLLKKLGIDPLDTTAAQAVEEFKAQYAPNIPESERSQEQLSNIGTVVENVTEAVNKPMSGLVGLGELATGQGLDQASQSIQDVQDEGLGVTLGERVLEETGNAELATFAASSPTLALELMGLKGALASGKALTSGVKKGAKSVQQTGRIAKDIYDTKPSRLPNAKQLKTSEMRQAIQDGSKYFVDKKIDAKTGRIVDDVIAKKALKQNISDETIAFTKRLDAGTNKQAKRILDRGAEILEFGEKTGGRPNALIGERVMKRFDTVMKANNSAGRDISKAVSEIKDTAFNIADDVDAFDDSLTRLGITRSDGVLNFKGSQIEGDSVVPLIKMMDKRLKTAYDAKSLHQEKQFIANKLYTKAGEAKVKGGTLDPKGVQILDDLRDGFNQKLRDASDDYAKANDSYSETIGTLNDFKKVMGQKKFNPYSDRIDNTIGNESRKLLTQYRSGQDMQLSIKNLNDMSAKYGGKFDDDIVELTRFYDNFEREFKSFSPGSFQAQTRDVAKEAAGVAFDATTGAPIQAAKGVARVGGKLMKKDPTERTRIKALKDLLKENK